VSVLKETIEEYLEKKVTIFLEVAGQPLKRTGNIIHVTEADFKFKDQFQKIETFANNTLEQIREVRE